jgi:hypothetical protein
MCRVRHERALPPEFVGRISRRRNAPDAALFGIHTAQCPSVIAPYTGWHAAGAPTGEATDSDGISEPDPVFVTTLADPFKSVHPVPHGIRQDQSYLREAGVGTAIP